MTSGLRLPMSKPCRSMVDLPQRWVGLAKVKRSLNSQADVRGELERAIQSDPGWFESYLELADLLIEKGEAEQALEVLVGSE